MDKNEYRVLSTNEDRGMIEIVSDDSYKKHSYERDGKLIGIEASPDKLKSLDKIRFVSSQYKQLFEADNFSDIYFERDGVKMRRTVVYIDEYHFRFIDSFAYHILDWGEFCAKNGFCCYPCEDE